MLRGWQKCIIASNLFPPEEKCGSKNRRNMKTCPICRAVALQEAHIKRLRRKDLIMHDSDTIYKLMILYMLNKLDMQLTNTQLSQFFITRYYANYFNIQQTISKLVESAFLEKSTIRNTTYYSITPEGYEALSYFKNQIPAGALEDMDKFLEENRFTLKNEVGNTADYYKHTSGDYIVHCQVMEGRSLLYEVNISVPSEEEAQQACNNWRDSSEDIYRYIMKNLLQ